MLLVQPCRSVVVWAWSVGVLLVFEFDSAIVEEVTTLGAETSDVPVSENWLRLLVPVVGALDWHLDDLLDNLLNNFLDSLDFLGA